MRLGDANRKPGENPFSYALHHFCRYRNRRILPKENVVLEEDRIALRERDFCNRDASYTDALTEPYENFICTCSLRTHFRLSGGRVATYRMMTKTAIKARPSSSIAFAGPTDVPIASVPM